MNTHHGRKNHERGACTDFNWKEESRARELVQILIGRKNHELGSLHRF